MRVRRGTVAGMKMLCGRKEKGRESQRGREREILVRGRETKINRERKGDNENGEGQRKKERRQKKR